MTKIENPSKLLDILQLITTRFAHRDITIKLKNWGEYDAKKFVQKFSGHKPVKYGWEARHLRASIMHACNIGDRIEYKLDVTGAHEQTTIVVTVLGAGEKFVPIWKR